MVTPEEIDEDLENDLLSECSKFGTVEKFTIDQTNAGATDVELEKVKIYILFKEPFEAITAVSRLNGRFFAGHQIIAELF